MLASLLTQLLGKVAEAKLMHAKAYNLPMFYNQMTPARDPKQSFFVNQFRKSWNRNH